MDRETRVDAAVRPDDPKTGADPAAAASARPTDGAEEVVVGAHAGPLGQRVDELRGELEISYRYHCKRRAFFDSIDIALNGVGLFAGAGAVVVALRDWPSILVTVGIVLAAVTALRIAVAPSRRARDHHDLARALLDAEHIIDEPECVDEACYRRALLAARAVERNEPRILRVLATICHNEHAVRVARAPTLVPITPWQYRLRHFWDFRADRLALPED